MVIDDLAKKWPAHLLARSLAQRRFIFAGLFLSDAFLPSLLHSFYLSSEDLLTLRDFSEPALLHTLRVRFSRLQSYTAVGTILVSVNPCKCTNISD